MHQRWKTFRASCSTHVFFQVDEKNALKHQKSWWLGVAPGFVVFSLIYLMDIRKKWQILVEVIFDPSSCLENVNKHRETTLHIPMPHQGPREHQNRAFRSNFSHLEVTMIAWNEVWKINFWLFFNFFQIFCIQWTQKPVERNLAVKIPHRGPKGHQIWPMGTGLRSWNGQMQPWKLTEIWIFWLFSQFFSIFSILCSQNPVETNLPIKIPHYGYKWHHIWASGRGSRFGNGHIQPILSQFWWLDMAIFSAYNCSN